MQLHVQEENEVASEELEGHHQGVGQAEDPHPSGSRKRAAHVAEQV